MTNPAATSDTATLREHRFRLLHSRPVTPVIVEAWFEPESEPLAYRAGQYVELSDADRRIWPRAYSIANAPRADRRISLLVTRVAGGQLSSWVHDELRAGDPVMLGGPYGTFTLDAQRSQPVLLLAAGSGLAPARALAEELIRSQPARPVTLFFSARTAADAIDRAAFLRWEQAHPSFRYLLTLTRERGAPRRGRIPQLLPECVGALGGCEVYVSGPPEFVVDCAAAATSLGADPCAVHTEEFFIEPQPWSGTPPATPQARTPR